MRRKLPFVLMAIAGLVGLLALEPGIGFWPAAVLWLVFAWAAAAD